MNELIELNWWLDGADAFVVLGCMGREDRVWIGFLL